jgi:type VI secretion system secreted protein VgrG
MMFNEKAEGRSTCSRFISGFVFELIDHDREAFNQEYLLVHVSHTGSQPQVLEEGADSAECSYTNEFFCIPSSVEFRPRLRAQKPVVEGVQTAMVVGPEGEEIYTDEHGRVKVQFHWDREGQRNERSSCWIRVSQVWAGAGWGAMFIPRIDQEVIVDFEEGDPDRPIITGRVYHGTNTPPYALPEEKTKSTIKSDSSLGGGGSNEFRFEDKSGEEEIYLHGQKDWTIAIEHDKEQNIGNDETSEVGNNRTRTVGEDEEVTVGNNRTVTIGNDETVTLGNNRTLEVGADENITIGGNRTEDVGTDQSITVGGNCTLNASGNVTITGEGNVELNGQRITITGQSEVSITVGGSTIRVSHSGVEISGSRISTDAHGINEISGELVTIN